MGKRANGEGTICKRKDGRFQGKLQIGYYPNGSTKFKTVTAKTQAECRRKLDKLKGDLKVGVDFKYDDMLFNSWLDIWFNEYQSNNKNSTKEVDLNRINKIIKPYFIKKKIKNINSLMIQCFYNELNKDMSASTVRKIHAIINKSLKQARKNGIIQINPCEAVTLPKVEKHETEGFSVEEQRRFIEAIKGHKYEYAYIFAILTGLRKGELLGLKWQDVDFKKRVLLVRRALYRRPIVINGIRGKAEYYFDSLKNDSSCRDIPLADELLELLKTHRKAQNLLLLQTGTDGEIGMRDNDLIFCKDDGSYIDPDNLVKEYKKILARNNLRKVKFHGLRHAFATRAMENGAPMKHVQKILGHSKMETTANIYSHVSEDEKRKVIDSVVKQQRFGG